MSSGNYFHMVYKMAISKLPRIKYTRVADGECVDDQQPSLIPAYDLVQCYRYLIQ